MSPSNETTIDESEAALIYDGDCPFCRNYIHMLRLKEAVGHVVLINARDGGKYVDAAIAKGLDLNEGMALFYDNTWYHGSDCMHALSLMTTPSGFFNRTAARIFRNPQRAGRLYPILRFGRNITLKILGVRQINQ